MRHIESGILSRPPEQLWFATLTSPDTDVTENQLRLSVIKWVRILRETHKHTVEYFLVPELAPKHNLWHLHGVIACQPNLDYHLAGKLWHQVHHARQVRFEHILHPQRLMPYMVKHLSKVMGHAARPIISRNYRPKTYQLTEQLLGRWGNDHAGFLPDAWQQVNKWHRQWCLGNTIELAWEGGLTYQLTHDTVTRNGQTLTKKLKANQN